MPTTKEQYAKKSKAEMFHILRREILTARLRATVDKQLHRPTPDKVRRVAAMELPPILSPEPGDPWGRRYCGCCCPEEL
ncbi:hypothetical protein [Nesterenkonia sp. Act20]|uniref:hypothetical protein n=1 Tax=Nesterenkonia sp. Act20 TaxID=1483432 RepID=UPI001C46F363|nr:hypothetical protein [Nesterenkonia sp. Act20]